MGGIHEPESRIPHAGQAVTAAGYRVWLFILLLYLVDGIDMQLLGVTVSALSRDWHLPLSAFSVAMAAGHAGSATGAVIGGVLGDRFGRRPVIIGGTLLFALLSLASALASNTVELALLRFAAGLGLGGCLPPALALLTEFVPGRRRGIAISSAILCSPLGIAFAGLFAMYLVPLGGWKAMFLLGGLLPLGLAALFGWLLPESPAFEAGQTVRRAVAQGRGGALVRLTFGKDRHKTLSLLGIFFACFFAMSMVLSWLPALLAQAGLATSTANAALTVWSLAGMPGVIAAGILMARWRTRETVGSGIGGSAVTLALVALALPHLDGLVLPLFALLAAAGFMLNGTMTAIYAYAAEIFPADIRASAIGLAATAGRVGAISGALAGARVLELGGPGGFFGAAAIIAGVALALYAVNVGATVRFGKDRAA